MSENIEFIAAKDLPEATGDEVSVLCLEGNELKQKPGASLAGACGYILKPTAGEINFSGSLTVTADVTDMVTAIEAGAPVTVVIPARTMDTTQTTAMSALVVNWVLLSGTGTLQGKVLDLGYIAFPGAPIPNFLQE